MEKLKQAWVDQFVYLHRNDAGEYTIEIRPDEDHPDWSVDDDQVVIYAQEALADVRRDIEFALSDPQEDYQLPGLRREEEFLEGFLRAMAR